MKQIAGIIAGVLLGSLPVFSQTEADSLRISPAASAEGESPVFSGVKEYGAFMLDMNLMNVDKLPRLTSFKLEVPDASKDYSRIFRLDPGVVYTQGLSDNFFLRPTYYYGFSPYGNWGIWDATDNLQMGSFRLNNGMRLNTYGEYNREGYKVPNPSALPWEKNDFKGAFELKSQDGGFSIRLEMEVRQKSPFGGPPVP